ncbi:MAG: LytR C-terminal domain-containing protein [Propionicimonas sp.]
MRQFIRVIKTPVTLIVLLAMLGFGAKWGYEQLTASNLTSSQACVMTDVGKELTPDKVSVRVLNGGNVAKMASLTKLYLNSQRFRVIYANNSERRVITTTIVGNSADDPEVRLLQQFFVGATAEGDGRVDHVVDVILTDKSKQEPKPVTSVAVSGPVCLPVITATSAEPTGSESAKPSATPTKKK